LLQIIKIEDLFMKYLFTGLLLIVANLALAADESGNAAIWGAGQKSCFSYLKARNSDDDGFYSHYLMGYLTAYNTLTPDTYRISGDKNLIDILGWLDAYCDERQVHGFDQAVLEFITEHYPKRYKRVPKAGRR
jgi:hypothetical protein